MEKQIQMNCKRVDREDFRCGKCGHVLARANSFTDPRRSARAFVEAVEAHHCASLQTPESTCLKQ